MYFKTDEVNIVGISIVPRGCGETNFYFKGGVYSVPEQHQNSELCDEIGIETET